MRGTLFGVGLGPGDPELLTLKAVRVLGEVDLILVPQSRKSGGSAARDILEAALGRDLPCREIGFSMEADAGTRDAYWADTAGTVARELDAGRSVAFATLGDVALYSTFSYLCRALGALKQYRVKRISGISSVQAAASRLGRELALGSDRLGVCPMPKNLDDLESFLEGHETVVVMKIGRRLEELRRFLKKRGLETSAGFVRRVSFPDEFAVDSMANLPGETQGGLSLVIVKGGKG